MTGSTDRAWDAIVIGAGPAGSVCARQLAREGLAVLLVDKAAFPRAKVCGCCLNRAALDTLDRIGLGHVPSSLGAGPFDSLDLRTHRGHRVTLPLAEGLAVSRERLDAALVREATAAGADFVPETAATVGDVMGTFCRVHLRERVFRARTVIAADGLAGTSLAGRPEFQARVASRSRIGVGAVIEHPPPVFPRGAITMICGRRGYVGAVWVEDHRLDIAAALDPEWLKTVGGPKAAIALLLAEAGIEAAVEAAWRGTPALTRRRRIHGERLLVIGDAAGYIEPFTGEGMAWAITGAEAAARLILDGSTAAWPRVHRALVGRAQLQCRILARMLRHPAVTDAAIRAIGIVPALASPFIRRMNRPASEAPA